MKKRMNEKLGVKNSRFSLQKKDIRMSSDDALVFGLSTETTVLRTLVHNEPTMNESRSSGRRTEQFYLINGTFIY